MTIENIGVKTSLHRDLPNLEHEIRGKGVLPVERDRDTGIEDAAAERYRNLHGDQLMMRANDITELLPPQTQDKVQSKLDTMIGPANEPALRKFMIEHLSYIEHAGRILSDAKDDYDNCCFDVAQGLGERQIATFIDIHQIPFVQRRLLLASGYLEKDRQLDHNPDRIIGAVLFRAYPTQMLKTLDRARQTNGTLEMTELQRSLNDSLDVKELAVTCYPEAILAIDSLRKAYESIPDESELISAQQILVNQKRSGRLVGNEEIHLKTQLLHMKDFLYSKEGRNVMGQVIGSDDKEAEQLRKYAIQTAKNDNNSLEKNTLNFNEYEILIDKAFNKVNGGSEQLTAQENDQLYILTQMIKSVALAETELVERLGRLDTESADLAQRYHVLGEEPTKELIINNIMASIGMYNIYAFPSVHVTGEIPNRWSQVVGAAQTFYNETRILDRAVNSL